MIRRAVENGIRYKKKTILNLMICMITVILLNAYMGNIAGVDKQMAELPEVLPVKGSVYNLKGTLATGLKIQEKYVDGILNSEYVSNPVFSIQLRMGDGRIEGEDYINRLPYYAVGINDAAAIPGFLESEIIFDGNVLGLSEPMDAQTFFASEERICVIDEELAKAQGIVPGQTVTMSAYYTNFRQDYSVVLEPLDIGEYTVVGFMNIENYTGTDMKPNIIIPFEAARNIFHENDIEFYASSASFYLKDPYEVNAFKEEMKTLQFMEVLPGARQWYDGYGLSIRDETFIQTAEQLIRNKNLLIGMLPFLGVAVLCIGYVTASLLIKGRKPEYAIMRSLGQGHGSCFMTICLEYALTALSGCVLGSVLGAAFLKGEPVMLLVVTGAFMVCYFLGEAAALWPLKRLSVMMVLSQND
ncbi:MAG: hypothetical protein HDR00_00970 [Lachnospiraceae bacterium]|nr:hypothetical protein [Lachnospiraceae bacterium]